MKKTIYTLFVMLLVGGLVAMGQIKPIKRQHSTKQKTEKTHKSKQVSSLNSSGKLKKTTNATTQKSSNPSNRAAQSSSSMTKTQMDPIIQQAIDDMVYIEGGTFTMGATREQGNEAYSDEKPAHQVTLSGFYISRYEVTQDLWTAVMGYNSRSFRGDARCPVEDISWEDCQAFIAKINRLTGKRFRLPTEAEWEYAARGGNQSRGYKYSGSNTLGNVAWYSDNSGRSTHPVGQILPNELGLYDMSGNVWEWCQDRYGHYDISSHTNPSGSPSGADRVNRGGSWKGYAGNCRVSDRRNYDPSTKYSDLGFRLAL